MKAATLIVGGLALDKHKGQNIAQINANTMKQIGVNSGEIMQSLEKRKLL